MTRSFHLWVIAISLTMACATAAAAGVSAELACLDAPRAERFESILLKVGELPAGFRGKAIRLQDARGGLRIARSIEGWSGGSSAPQHVIMLPLPLISAAELPRDRWPVVVTLVGMDDAEIREPVDVSLAPIGPAGGVRRVLEVRGGGGGEGRGTPLPSTVESSVAAGRQPTVTARMSEADFLRSPALALAGFDVVDLDAHAASSLSGEQVAALLNAGLRVVVQQADAPAGKLGGFVWDRTPGDSPATSRWITPREAFAPPRVVEAALVQARSLQIQAEASSGMRRILLAVGPVGILLVVLCRLMIRRSKVLLGVVTVALIVWTGMAIACAAMQASPVKSTAAWVTRNAPPVTPATLVGGDATALHESFTASSSLIARDMDLLGRPGEILWPAVAKPRQYFALDQAELLLDQPDSGRRVERLTMHVPEDGVVIARRSVQPTALTAAFPAAPEEATRWAIDAGIDPAQAWRLEAGYVSPVTRPGEAPRLFSQWAVQAAPGLGIGNAGECWFALRFAGNHRYIIARQAASEPSLSELVIIDCGLLGAASVPATGASSGPGS